MSGIPIYFGEIAKAEGYITDRTLKECLEIQKKHAKSTLIGEIFIEKGFLAEEHVTRVLKLQQTYKGKLENEYFAHIALKKKYLNAKQIWELRKKYFQEITNKRHTTFATLAVTNNFLAMPIVEEIIKSQEYKYFNNAKKQGITNIAGYELVGSIIKLKRTAIYKAIQIELDRLVAIKTLLREYETSDHIQKFFTEARVTSRFNHPNLVRVYDIGLSNNSYYYAMEFVEGENLSQKLSSVGRLQVGEALKIIRQIAKALAHIHKHGQIHKKVNPKNIAIRQDGVAKLLDLSFCSKSGLESETKVQLTKMPQYMAPEQFQPGELLNERTDIYNLGATFYRMLTGQPPVTGKTLEEIRHKIIEDEPLPVNEIDFTIPEDLAKIISRMMRKNPKKRYKEMRNVLFALKKILI